MLTNKRVRHLGQACQEYRHLLGFLAQNLRLGAFVFLTSLFSKKWTGKTVKAWML